MVPEERATFPHQHLNTLRLLSANIRLLRRHQSGETWKTAGGNKTYHEQRAIHQGVASTEGGRYNGEGMTGGTAGEA